MSHYTVAPAAAQQAARAPMDPRPLGYLCGRGADRTCLVVELQKPGVLAG